jgi:hypothetical protein
MNRKILSLLVVLVTSGCAGSSTSPSDIVSLSLDRAAVTLPRTTSVQLTAIAASRGGASRDVTSLVEWSSLNPHVAIVIGGRITAVGIGSAVVTARYEGLAQTVAVTARRRTAVKGELTVADAEGLSSISELDVYLDSWPIGSKGVSGTRVSLTVSLDARSDADVEPGMHELSVTITHVSDPRVARNTYVSDATSHLAIVDRDTSETVVVLPLLSTVVAVPTDANGRMAWSIEVGVYSS